MQDVGIAYTIGLKRRFLPGFKKHKCIYHVQDAHGLELHLADGSALWVASFAVKSWIVYPDYRTAQDKIERLKRSIAPQPAPRAAPVDDQAAFDEILANVRAQEVPIQG